MNSDEGEGSDDNSKDYSKVSNYEFNFEKKPYKSGSKYDYKANPSKALSDAAVIDSNASYHLNPPLMSNDNVFGVQNAKCVNTEKSLQDLGQSEEIDEHEALSSMMSFFTYCHKVESEKEANC
jgi:hypothetical protein